MVIVFSGNRGPSKKREKLRLVNGEGIFRYSAAVVREKHENVFFGER
jgi:hypothetical protein